jgi:hypothetical protein
MGRAGETPPLLFDPAPRDLRTNRPVGRFAKSVGDWGGVRYTGWLWRRDLNQEE